MILNFCKLSCCVNPERVWGSKGVGLAFIFREGEKIAVLAPLRLSFADSARRILPVSFPRGKKTGRHFSQTNKF